MEPDPLPEPPTFDPDVATHRDVLIRNVPVESLHRLDWIAGSAGLSRNAYLRRLIDGL